MDWFAYDSGHLLEMLFGCAQIRTAEEFEDAYVRYAQKIPAFFPQMGTAADSASDG